MRSPTITRNRALYEQGFTLVELLVYMLLLGIVGTMVVMFIVNGFRSQVSVTETTQSNGDAQNVARALEYDIRYAEQVEIYEAGTLLRARTWVGDPNDGGYVCRGWKYDADSGELLRSTVTSQVLAGPSASWNRYAQDIDAATFFERLPSDDGVKIRFDALTQREGVATKVDTEVVPREQSDAEGIPGCFP